MSKKYETSDFQGKNKIKKNRSNNIVKLKTNLSNHFQSSIRSDEVEYHLTKVYSEINKDDSFEQLLEGRKVMGEFMNNLKAKFAKILNLNTDKLTEKNKNDYLNCYEILVSNLNDCIPLHVHTYLYRYLYLFVNACNQIKIQKDKIQISDLNQIILEQCNPFKKSFIELPKIV
jgi:hypothetical protein